MNYKNLLLAGLFLPIFGHTQDDISHLKELKDSQSRKAPTIRELETMVSEGEEFLRYFNSIYNDRVKQVAVKKKKILDALAEKNNTKKKTLKEIEQSIFDENDLICKDDLMHRDLTKILHGTKDLRHSFANELAKVLPNLENIKKGKVFSSDIFLLARAIFEQDIMVAPTIEHKRYLQRMLAIIKEIYDLDKKNGNLYER